MPNDDAPFGQFQRDRLTWVLYWLLFFFAYLQAAPGLVVPYLRDEIGMSYSIGGLHVAAFAAGAIVGGLLATRLERMLGRRGLLWSGITLMAAGAFGLTVAPIAELTIGSVLVIGGGGGLVLVAIQAALSDHHGDRRGVALSEANLAASVGYLVLIGALALTAALLVGWRVAILASLAIPVVAWLSSRRVAIDAPPPSPEHEGQLPREIWIAAGVMFCCTAAEWSVIAWGALFLEEVANVPTEVAVTLMAGYFGGVLVGRILSSRLTRRSDPARLLAVALGVAAVGFAILWPSTTPAPALIGLLLLGVGLGNLFPLGAAVTIALAPLQAALASARIVVATALAGLLAPLIVGPLADATSLLVALVVVPIFLAVAATGLAVVGWRGRAPAVSL